MPNPQIDLGAPDPVNLGRADEDTLSPGYTKLPIGRAGVRYPTNTSAKAAGRGMTSVLPELAPLIPGGDIPPVTAVYGAALNGVRRLIDNVLGLQLPGEKKMTAGQIASESAIEGGKQGLFMFGGKAVAEGAASLGNAALRKTVGRAAESIMDNPEAQKSAAINAKYDLGRTPAEVTQHPVLKSIQKVATAQPYSKPVAVAAEKKTLNRVTSLLSEWHQTFGPALEDQATGRMVQDALKAGEKMAGKEVDAAYDANRAAAQAEGVTVPRSEFMPVVQKMKEDVATVAEHFPGSTDPRVGKMIDSMEGETPEFKKAKGKAEERFGGHPPAVRDKLVNAMLADMGIEGPTREIPWSVVDQKRHQLFQMMTSDSVPSEVRSAATRLHGALTDVMGESASKAGGATLRTWEEARAMHAATKSLFTNSLYREVLTKAPEAMAESIGIGETTKVDLVKQVLLDAKHGNPAAFDAFRSRWVVHHLVSDVDTGKGIEKIWDNIKKMSPGGSPSEFERAMFPDKAGREYMSRLREIGWEMQTSRKVTNVGMAGVLAEQSAAHEGFRAAISLAFMRYKSLPFLVARQMVGPVAAKIAFDPEATRLLVEGAKLIEAKPGKGINLMLRSIDLATKEGAVFEKYEKAKRDEQ